MDHCSIDDHIFLHALAQQYAFQLPLLSRLYKKKPDPKLLWELSPKELQKLTPRLIQKTIDELYKRKQLLDVNTSRAEIEELRNWWN